MIQLLTLIAALLASSLAHAIEVQFEPDETIPLVYVNFALRAGSVTDPEGREGLTNLLGELMLRGTQLRDKAALDAALDQIGGKLEVETRAEALIFRGKIIASELEPFLKLLTEIVTLPSFPEAELKKLKSELVAGLLQEQSQDRQLSDKRFQKFLFGDHPYGRHELGTTRSIQATTVENIREQYERLFNSRYFLVVGSGAASSSQIRSWANELAEKRPDPEGASSDPFFRVGPPLPAEAGSLLVVDKPDRTQTQIDIGQVGVRMSDPDFFPLFLANHAFGGPSFLARLMVEIRVKRGWSYGAGSGFRHGLQPRLWRIHLFPAAKDAAAALEYTLGMVKDLRDRGITPEEFDFAKQSIVNSAGFMYNTPKKRIENALLERTLDLPEGIMQKYGSRVGSVSFEEANDALKRFLKPERMAISVLATARTLKPALAKAAATAGVTQVKVERYNAE